MYITVSAGNYHAHSKIYGMDITCLNKPLALYVANMRTNYKWEEEKKYFTFRIFFGKKVLYVYTNIYLSTYDICIFLVRYCTLMQVLKYMSINGCFKINMFVFYFFFKTMKTVCGIFLKPKLKSKYYPTHRKWKACVFFWHP